MGEQRAGKATAGVRGAGRGARFGLFLGPALAVLIWLLPGGDLSPEAQRLAALTALMATWWMTEAIPVAATALLPLGLFPILGIAPAGETASAYGKDLIWLFFGGFQLAFAIERWGLHRRIALFLVRVVGTRDDRLVLGFMLAAGLLSMWLLNTSTTLMMLPVGMAVASAIEGDEIGPFGKALMLGIAYAASVGGMGTYVGTAPNGIFAGVARGMGVEISFGEWMLFAAPLAVLLMLMIWWYLTRVAFPLQRKALPEDHPASVSLRERMGSLSNAEKLVGVVFLVAVSAWILRKPLISKVAPMMTDATVAIAATLLLYLVPVRDERGPGEGERTHLLTWAESVRTPWHILLLFGGGFALAGGFQQTGLSAWMGGLLAQAAEGMPIGIIILLTVLLVTFLTEVTSNTATSTVLLPVIGGLAVAMELPPQLLMVPATLAASCAFMLPVATPPNAIVYASGRFDLRDMARAGFWINIGTGFVITGWMLTWGRLTL